MSEFKFVDDLPVRKSRGVDPRIARFAKALRSQPGKWALWPNGQTAASAHSMGTRVRSGNYKPFPSGEFEASVRSGALYVRYVGGES